MRATRINQKANDEGDKGNYLKSLMMRRKEQVKPQGQHIQPGGGRLKRFGNKVHYTEVL